MTGRWLRAWGAVLAIVVAGCAGSKFVRQPDDALILGKTTEGEIRQRLGTPYREGVVTKNERQLKTLSYAYAAAGSMPLHDGATPGKSQGFYFLDDRLVGYEFVSSWKEDHTDFDSAKIAQVKKGSSTRAEVRQLLGPGGGRYIYPLIREQDQEADCYLYSHVAGSAFSPRLYQKQLVVTYDKQGVVTNVDYTESGQK